MTPKQAGSPDRAGRRYPRGRWEIPITPTVFSLILVIAVGLAALLILYNYQKNAEAALVVAEQMMAEVSETVFERVQALGQPIGAIANLAPTWNGVAEKPTLLNHPTQAQIEQHLEDNPQISSIYLGFDDGDFFQVHALGEESARARAAIDAPSDARFATRLIAQRPDRRRVEIWKFLDADRRIVGSRVVRDPEFDPRERRWFELAMASDATVRTDPYAFASTRAVGMTVARRFDGDVPGVVGVDLTLSGISHFLRAQGLHGDGLIMLFRRDGTVIAYPDLDLLIAEGANDGAAVELAKITDLGDPLAVALHHRYGDDALANVIEVDGRRYVGRVQSLPVRAGSEELLGILLPVERFTGPIAAIGRRSVVMSVIILLASMPLIWLMSRRISGPLQRLASEAEEIRAFRLDAPIELTSHVREIRLLANAMARMKSGLRVFGLYVPKALVRQLIESEEGPALGGQRREITVLFTDIAGFTDLSETMAPEATMEKLSAYFEELTTVLMANGATIDKYIGDAIMALWNAPVADADHVAHACRAALLTCAANNALNRRWAAEGQAEMWTRFGLHVGDAVVGNVGSSDRMNYTAIGATVNLAARLEALNKHYGTRILVSEAVARRVEERFVMRTISQVVPKGISAPIRILELRGAIESDEIPEAVRSTDGDRAWCRRWEDAYAAFVARDWAQALDGFRELADDVPGDGVARIYAERAEHYCGSPPGADWTPVETFLAK